MDEPWKWCANQQKPDVKGHMFFDFIYMKCPEKANPWRLESSGGCQGPRGEKNAECLLIVMQVLRGWWARFRIHEFQKWWLHNVVNVTGSHGIVHFKMMSFMLHEIYLNLKKKGEDLWIRQRVRKNWSRMVAERMELASSRKAIVTDVERKTRSWGLDRGWALRSPRRRHKFWSRHQHASGTEVQIKPVLGLPWWLSGQESACQCRGHGFKPWCRKIPHAVKQLKPTCHNYWACAAEPGSCVP